MTDVTIAWSICLSISHLSKAVGWNEMPFGRDTRVVPSNTGILDGPQSPTVKGYLEVETPSQNFRCKLWPNRYRSQSGYYR